MDVVINTKQCQFEATVYSQFVKDVRKMMLHRFLTQGEIGCDLYVRITLHHGLYHLDFAWSQPEAVFRMSSCVFKVKQCVHELLDAAFAEPVITVDYPANAIEQRISRFCLQDNPAHSNMERADGVFLRDGTAQQDNAHFVIAIRKLREHMHTIVLRKVVIKQEDVGLESPHKAQSFFAIRTAPYHFEPPRSPKS